MLGLQDVAEDEELVTEAEGFEGVEEGGAGVVVTFRLVTLQTTRHGGIVAREVCGPHSCAKSPMSGVIKEHEGNPNVEEPRFLLFKFKKYFFGNIIITKGFYLRHNRYEAMVDQSD